MRRSSCVAKGRAALNSAIELPPVPAPAWSSDFFLGTLAGLSLAFLAFLLLILCQ